MKKGIIHWLYCISAITLFLSGCSPKSIEEPQETPTEASAEASSEMGAETLGPKPVIDDIKTMTISDFKNSYGEKGLNALQVSPLYNMPSNAMFTFHFNSAVDPMKAVTVHTDAKCQQDSILYLINKGYKTQAGGVDVIVSPEEPVMDVSERTDFSTHGTWGYAPIYYISINYDLYSDDVIALEEPLIIPFTIANAIQTPNAYSEITENGTFCLKWLPVKGATGYRIYESLSPKGNSILPSQMNAYIGEELTLVAEVDSNVTEYTDFTKDGISNVLSSGNDIPQQNYFDLTSYYVTALKKENESFFSQEVSAREYSRLLPQSFDSQSGFRRTPSTGKVTELSSTLPVTLCDGSVIQMPAEYQLLDSQHANQGAEGYCTYRYVILNTLLTGTVDYFSESGEYPKEKKHGIVKECDVYYPRDSIEHFPALGMPTIGSEEYTLPVELQRTVNYPDASKIQYSANALEWRGTMEQYRHDNGIYQDGNAPSNILSYLVMEDTTVNTAIPYTENKESSDTIEDINTQESSIGEDTKQEPSVTESHTMGLEGSETNSATNNGQIVPEQLARCMSITDAAELKPSKKITSISADNIIGIHLYSSFLDMSEAEKEKITVTAFPIFYDNAPEAYLANMLVLQQTSFSVKAFPQLMEWGYLADALNKVYCQNPYIMGIESFGVDTSTGVVVIRYSYDADTAARMQAELKKKIESIIQEYILINMSDTDKIASIWDYLESHAVFTSVKQTDTNPQAAVSDISSYTAYGLLCQDNGTSQAYAGAFKLLCKEAGIDSAILTGYFNGPTPHAWNAIRLLGKWYWIDTSNNVDVIEIPHMLYLASSEYAGNLGYVPDRFFELDKMLDIKNAYDNSLNWYYSHSMVCYNDTELFRIVAENIQSGLNIYIRCNYTFTGDSGFYSQLFSSLKQNGFTEDFIASTKFSYKHGYFIVEAAIRK